MIRLGIIGLGQAAQILHLPNLEKMTDAFQLTAVADISTELVSYIGDKYRVANRFSDGAELIRCPDVDAVMILCGGDHAEYAIAALEADKHVFIEKPMTLSRENAEKLMAVKRQHPELVAMVGYCRRYNDSFLKMKELLRSDDRSISYVRARTLVLEGPWYLANTWHEKKATDLPPVDREAMQEKMFREYRAILGQDATEAKIWAYMLLTASGCHILSAVRELIGLPREIRSVVVSPTGMQFTLTCAYDGFNMVFEEMNDQSVVEFDESIEIYQGDRKMSLKYDSPYIHYLPTQLTVSELEDGQAKTVVYGPQYHDMFFNELLEFRQCIAEKRAPKCDVFDAAEDVSWFLDIAEQMR